MKIEDFENPTRQLDKNGIQPQAPAKTKDCAFCVRRDALMAQASKRAHVHPIASRHALDVQL
jgi:hypothetical protein